MALHGDLGLLRGSGAVTTQRLYWNNLDTSICSDVPSEARLAPANWDLFKLFPSSQAEMRKAVPPSATLTAGLCWSVFEAERKELADLSQLKPTTSGTAAGVELTSPKARANDFAVLYESFIDVPSTSMWSFSADVDDAVRVVVDAQRVLDGDIEVAGSLTGTPFALKKGLHRCASSSARSAAGRPSAWTGAGRVGRPDRSRRRRSSARRDQGGGHLVFVTPPSRTPV